MPGREAAVAGSTGHLRRLAAWGRGPLRELHGVRRADGREPFDLVIAIGAEQIDRYLHEHPELKRFAYAWITDRVGWAVAGESTCRWARLAADANAGMAALVEARPDVRDLADLPGRGRRPGRRTAGSRPAVGAGLGSRAVRAVGPAGAGEQVAAARDIASRLLALL